MFWDSNPSWYLLVLVSGPRLRPSVPHVIRFLVEEEHVEFYVTSLERQLKAVLRLQDKVIIYCFEEVLKSCWKSYQVKQPPLTSEQLITLL